MENLNDDELNLMKNMQGEILDESESPRPSNNSELEFVQELTSNMIRSEIPHEAQIHIAEGVS